MKLWFLHDLPLMEALEIDPLEIEAFIKENNLEDIASVKGGILHIWRYRIPLNYKKSGALPPKYLFALSKLFKLIDSMSSKRYSDLFDIEPEESEALKNLILKAIMPHDGARELAATLTKNPEKHLRSIYGAYKKIDNDVDIMQLPKNLALLLSAAISLKNNKRHNPMQDYMDYDHDANDYVQRDDEESRSVLQKVEELKKLSSHSKRLNLFQTASFHVMKHYSYTYDKVPDISFLDKAALRLFVKLEDVEKAGYHTSEAGLSRALQAVVHIKNIKSLQHAQSIPFSFWNEISNLRQDMEYRLRLPIHVTTDKYKTILEWWAKNPEAERQIIVDTLAMANRYNQPVKFLNRDLAALQAEHDELTELSQAEEKKQTFNNDVLQIKNLDVLRLEYLNNTYDLKYEGKIMKHCVGSYSDDCVSGRSVIYRIYWNEKHIGTLDLSSSGDFGKVTVDNAEVRQAYGKRNSGLSKIVNQTIRKLLHDNKLASKQQLTVQQQRATRKQTDRDFHDQQAGIAPEPEMKFELENCYECGSFNTQEGRDGTHCQDCGHFEADDEG